jgi:hypothetical protein
VGGLAIVDGVSIINTQKTLEDHIVSLVTGKDCSILKASHGEPYCQDIPPPVPTIERTTYCYKSLAKAVCYDQPLAQDDSRYMGSRVDNVPVTVK